MNITELRIAQIQRNAILASTATTPLQRAQAHADFYAAIRKAHASGMSNSEITEGAQISRQRLWQIVRPPAPGRAALTEAHLPEDPTP